MKRIVVLLLIAALAVGLLAPMTASAAKSGGWEINTKVGNYLTKAEKAVFAKATDKLEGVSYTPVYTIAKQTVSGTNYAFFCQAKVVLPKATPTWKIVIVNVDTEGEVKILAVNNFNYKKIKTRNSAYKSNLIGGWVYNGKTSSSKGLPSAAKKAFKQATEGYVGVTFTPLALLGTQVVSGKNYMFLCRGVAADISGTASLYEVVVYQNANGKSKITGCEIINMPKYLQVK